MSEFTAFDIVAALIVVISAVLAYFRGFVREAMSIVGWIAAAVIAYFTAPLFSPLVGDLPVVGEFFRGSCEMSVIATFAIIMALALVLISIITMLFNEATKLPGVNALNSGAGFIFGVIRGAVLVLILLILNDMVIPSGTFTSVAESQSAKILQNLQGEVREQGASVTAESIKRAYNSFTAICGGGLPPAEIPELPGDVPELSPDAPADSGDGLSTS